MHVGQTDTGESRRKEKKKQKARNMCAVMDADRRGVTNGSWMV